MMKKMPMYPTNLYVHPVRSHWYIEEGCLDAPDFLPAGSLLSDASARVIGFPTGVQRTTPRGYDMKWMNFDVGNGVVMRAMVPGDYDA
jgi:hypothetical protein